MGNIIHYENKKNKDCKFRLDFHAGVGFALAGVQNRVRENMRSGKWGDHWKELMDKYPEGTATCNNALCLCKKCRKYFTEPRVMFYIPEEGFHYEYSETLPDTVPEYVINEHYQLIEKEIIKCPDCGTDAVVVEDWRTIKCPYCGRELEGRIAGYWD